MKYFTSLLIIITFMLGCQNPDSSPTGQNQADNHDAGKLSILIFQDGMEFYAETDQLVNKEPVSIAAHLTHLENYTPVTEGTLFVRFVQKHQASAWTTLELAQAGIFTGEVSPPEPGLCSFQFKYKLNDEKFVFSKDSLKVYTHYNAPPEEEHHEGLSFSKEQAWHTEFGLLPLVGKDFSRALHCSGEISMVPGNMVDVIAPASGKITFANAQLAEGSYVKKGSLLLILSGTGLGQNNIILEFNTAKAEYEKSKANFERKEKLLKMAAVSKKDYDEAKASYQGDQTRYQILKSQLSKSGIGIKSPVSGFITRILCSSNSYAETGSVLINIIKEGGLLIKANVPSAEAFRISTITSANFKQPSDPAVYSINDFKGKLFSSGRTVDPQTGMIPVFFSINKANLIPGTFVELWLLTGTINNQLVVPESSLLEEYGHYYVYVQKDGESYEKRAIHIADNDGINYLVDSGLRPGEVIVSKGVMAIKVANAMGAVPVHHH